ncbi:MAG: hypothetical protein Q9219_006364 [cf. Caloplaca sp. 3 TL-2023]
MLPSSFPSSIILLLLSYLPPTAFSAPSPLLTYLHPLPTAPSPDPPPSPNSLRGINCRGSLYCKIYAGAVIPDALQLATGTLNIPHASPAWNLGPLNASALYAPPHHIICLPVDLGLGEGFCVFKQGWRGGPGDGKEISGEEVRRGLGMLMEHGCRMCGSVPVGWLGGMSGKGEGVEERGWLTVNYVSSGVCAGVCPGARYE